MQVIKDGVIEGSSGGGLPPNAATETKQDTIIGHLDGVEGLLGTIDADTSVLAGAVAGTEMQVDVVSMPSVTISALPDEGQQTMANSISVAIASNQSAVPVSGTVTASLAAGTNNIGDVDVLSVPAPLNVVGGGTQASALRVTLATDSTGVISVDDNGGSLTVDGTVAATQSGTWNVNNVTGTVSLPTGAATSANQASMVTALQLLDNVVATDGAAAVTQLYQVGGTDGTNAQIISTNTSGHVNVADGGGSLTVDGTVAVSGTVPVTDNGGSLTVDGTVSIGSIAAGTNNIGDVDVVSVPAPLNVVGGGTEAAALRVTLANDSTGVVSVDDNGGSLTVDGTVAATQSGTWNVNNVTGTVSLPTGAATEVKQDTAITSLQLLDDTVSTPNTASAGKGIQLVGDFAGSARLVQTDLFGQLIVTVGNDLSLTELPAPTATSDGMAAGGTMSRIGTYNAVFNGATWDRMRGDASNGVLVDLGANNDVSVSGTVAATQSGAWSVGLNAGTNNIGDVDVASVPAPLNVTGGGTEASALRVTIASDSTGVVSVDDNGGSLTVDGTVAATQSGTWNVNSVGNVAHDAADSGNPVKVGAKAIAHGTNPTAVAAGDRTDIYANRHGIPFVIGGHPNIISYTVNYTTAQNNTAIITVGAGTKIVVTRCTVTVAHATTVDVNVAIGFAAATLDTNNGIILSHPGIAPGSGVREGVGAGILGIGGDGEDLRIKCGAVTGGSMDVVLSYYTIES